jgi:hypothetical protein
LKAQDNAAPPESAQKILVAGKTIGSFGTIVPSIDGETLLALAYLRVQHADTGATIDTEIGTLTVL